jgi:drug/metabolite transporter (DMT)-like permease
LIPWKKEVRGNCNLSKIKNLKGSFILLIAAFIWGTTFAAQTAAAAYIDSFTFNFCRCVAGSVFLGMIIAVREISEKSRSAYRGKKWPWIPGILCGVVLFLAMNLQQAGIGLYPKEAAASGRSGFLTATYVIMVAAVVQLRGWKKGVRLSPVILISVIGTVCGMYLLCLSEGLSDIYTGDILELLCAVCFTIHILVVDQFADVDSIRLCCMQFIVCGILSFVPMVLIERPQSSEILAAGIPILYAGILSGGVAYTLQMVGQKYAQPAVASIVMSMESVFAVLAGCILLQETMTAREMTGCVLMFASVIAANVPNFFAANK